MKVLLCWSDVSTQERTGLERLLLASRPGGANGVLLAGDFHAQAG